jgi:tryptophan synthase beta chain
VRRFGGKYVPETLIPALAELEVAYQEAIRDPAFQVRRRRQRVPGTGTAAPLLTSAPARARALQPPPTAAIPSPPQAELSAILKDYVGRETPLYFAERLSDRYRR